VVLKPWGYEFQVYDNGTWSIWMLCINPGQGTSIHCHATKKAIFIPLSGQLSCKVQEGIFDLNFPESMEVEEYSFHAVRNNTESDILLLEAETPSDKADLFRLNDRYGRGQGYERDVVRGDLDKYGHFLLDNSAIGNIGEFRISVLNGQLSVIGSKAIFRLPL
jgi:mannose-6-phosphate isomerase-like protein (cupin superfamily)